MGLLRGAVLEMSQTECSDAAEHREGESYWWLSRHIVSIVFNKRFKRPTNRLISGRANLMGSLNLAANCRRSATFTAAAAAVDTFKWTLLCAKTQPRRPEAAASGGNRALFRRLSGVVCVWLKVV